MNETTSQEDLDLRQGLHLFSQKLAGVTLDPPDSLGRTFWRAYSKGGTWVNTAPHSSPFAALTTLARSLRLQSETATRRFFTPADMG